MVSFMPPFRKNEFMNLHVVVTDRTTIRIFPAAKTASHRSKFMILAG